MPERNLREWVNAMLHEVQSLDSQNELLRKERREVESSRNHFSLLFDQAPIACVCLDARQVIREVNVAAAGLFGTDRGRLVGAPLRRFVAASSREALDRYWQAVSAGGTGPRCKLHMARFDRSRFPALAFGHKLSRGLIIVSRIKRYSDILQTIDMNVV